MCPSVRAVTVAEVAAGAGQRDSGGEATVTASFGSDERSASKRHRPQTPVGEARQQSGSTNTTVGYIFLMNDQHSPPNQRTTYPHGAWTRERSATTAGWSRRQSVVDLFRRQWRCRLPCYRWLAGRSTWGGGGGFTRMRGRAHAC